MMRMIRRLWATSGQLVGAVGRIVPVGALALCGLVQPAAADGALEKAREQGYVEIGIGAGGFPYAALGEDGKPVGAAPEIAMVVLEKLGIPEVRPRVVDWGALIPGLMAKRFDIVTTGMFMNRERCEAVLFSKPDTCSLEAFMVKKGNPLNLHTYKDIAANPDIKVGMAPGSSQERMALEAGVPAERIVTDTEVQNKLKLLQTGRIDVWADPSDTFAALQNKDPNFEVVMVKDLPPSCAGAVFRKEDRDFRDAYDAALTKIQESGEFDAILAKYGFPADIAKQTTREQLCGGPN